MGRQACGIPSYSLRAICITKPQSVKLEGLLEKCIFFSKKDGRCELQIRTTADNTVKMKFGRV